MSCDRGNESQEYIAIAKIQFKLKLCSKYLLVLLYHRKFTECIEVLANQSISVGKILC